MSPSKCVIQILVVTICVQLLALDTKTRLKIVKEADLAVKGGDVDSEAVEMAKEVVELLR